VTLAGVVGTMPTNQTRNRDAMTDQGERRQQDGRAAGCEIFLTSYMLGAPDGKNLGAPGYSHEFVARLFRPLLERFGTVREVRHAGHDLQPAIDECVGRGVRAIHFSVLPFQDVCIARDAANVVMPAWEFPDVPDHGFDGNPQNDWPATADRCDLVIVSGPFTERALVRGGTTTPIRTVPVPTPDAYFAVPPWRAGETHRIGCPAYVFDEGREPDEPARGGGGGRRRLKECEKVLRTALRGLVGVRRYERLSAWIKSRRHTEWRSARKPDLAHLPYPKTDSLELSGVVYTSIFNPDDGRKNWQDLLSGWLAALADRPDATLVVKLIVKREKSVRKVIDHYVGRGIRHRCRVVFICEFLSDEQMLTLCRATTFYAQATRAEGNCLPLMNYLAAGRPGVSPDHSSMSDYFGPESGFVVESHPEPSAWPHDRRLRQRTTWGRIVWTSLRDRIAESYRLATAAPERYEAMAGRCRDAMRAWAGSAAVARRLEAALAEIGATPAAAAGPPETMRVPQARPHGGRAAA